MKYGPKYVRVLFGNVWVYAFVSETCSLGKGIFVTCHKFPRALWFGPLSQPLIQNPIGLPEWEFILELLSVIPNCFVPTHVTGFS